MLKEPYPTVTLDQLLSLFRTPDERPIVHDLLGVILLDDPEAEGDAKIEIDALVHDSDDQRWLCRALGMDERCVLDLD